MTIYSALTWLALLAGQSPDHFDCLAEVPQVEVAALLRVLRSPEKSPPEFVQAACRKLAALPPPELPELVRGMDAVSLPAINWLRSAGEQIVARAERDHVPLPTNDLIRLADNPQLSPEARRIAYLWATRNDAKAAERFLLDRLADPVFAAEAVDVVIGKAESSNPSSDAVSSRSLLRKALEVTTVPEQTIRLAAALAKSGETVDANRQLGFITRWWAMGPLAGEDQAGVVRDYGPETRVDLKEMRDGLSGPVGWKAVSLPKDATFIDLKKELGQADDAVAYLWTAVEAPQELSVELRGGADDNLQVWLNGNRVIDERDFQQRPRLDKHRAKVTLRPGRNEVLLKVCEAKLPPGPPSGSPPRWQATLRIVDSSGRGLSLPTSPVDVKSPNRGDRPS